MVRHLPVLHFQVVYFQSPRIEMQCSAVRILLRNACPIAFVVFHIIETYPPILAKFCTTTKTDKYSSRPANGSRQAK